VRKNIVSNQSHYC